MPGEDYQSWSTSATLNGNADSAINWAEGQPRASVNNSARSLMAAHAKDRDLRNGSIVAGGSVNALTFFSGLNYTTTPTGLTVRLKIGPSLTNTGPATLNMDNIGQVQIINNADGLFLRGGEMVADSYRDFCWNGTNWVLFNTTSETSMAAGRLTWVSTNVLKFAPYNGAKIKIAGVLFDIPAAGIAGLDATLPIFVNGVASGTLVINTLYYVYAFNNAGVVTADFSTTGHATSSTAGNVGTEVKSGDDSRSLIGMIRMFGLTFTDSGARRFVLSWFNRAPKSSGTVFLPSPSSIGSGPWTDINGAYRIEFLVWAGDAVTADLNSVCKQQLIGTVSFLALGWDGAERFYVYWTAPGNDYAVPVSLSGSGVLAEGYHYQYVGAGITASSGTLTIDASGYTSMSATVMG